MSLIDLKFEILKNTPSDINEHFLTIKKYASECNTITEMGVRKIVSTWALLSGKPKKMVSIDIEHPNNFDANIEEVYEFTKFEGIKFEFIKMSSLNIIIDETDLLFIDTLHEYNQLKQELNLHGNKAKKYIILHDTETFKLMNLAFYEFIDENKHWIIKEMFFNNNGLTILERI